LRLLSFGGYGLALAALALVVFGAYDSYPTVQRLMVLPSDSKNLLLGIDFMLNEKHKSYLIFLSKGVYIFMVFEHFSSDNVS